MLAFSSCNRSASSLSAFNRSIFLKAAKVSAEIVEVQEAAPPPPCAPLLLSCFRILASISSKISVWKSLSSWELVARVFLVAPRRSETSWILAWSLASTSSSSFVRETLDAFYVRTSSYLRRISFCTLKSSWNEAPSELNFSILPCIVRFQSYTSLDVGSTARRSLTSSSS